jgi:putative membrane protein
MLIRWLLAAIHLLGYGVALASILARTRALRRCSTPARLPEVFLADNGWGLSALVLVVTGALRAFGGYEKGSAFYLHEPLFHLKMGLLVLILILEIAPMVTLIRWRIAVRKGGVPDLRRVRRFAGTGAVQAVLLVAMVVAATGMARGIGLAADGA